MIELPRRRFLQGVAALFVAPAIVRASSLMPVRSERAIKIALPNYGYYAPAWDSDQQRFVMSLIPGSQQRFVRSLIPDTTQTYSNVDFSAGEKALIDSYDRKLQEQTARDIRTINEIS